MKGQLVASILGLLLAFSPLGSFCQVTADFFVADTVCAGEMVNIQNQSTGGTTFYWSFCSGNTVYNPVGINIGNPGNLLSVPVYMTLVREGDNCYSFITNEGNRCLVRYYHGKSFNNNPVSWTNLGTFNLIGDSVEGIRIRHDNGKWIGLINNNNRLVRLNFGSSLGNSPTSELLGPYSFLNTAHCLELLNESGTWVGYLTCTWGNNLVRLNFSNNLLNPPVLTNLGTLGGILNMPSFFSIVRENQNWYAVTINKGSNHARLEWGSSLLNNPVAFNLGQVCGAIPLGGLVLIRDCDATTGFQLNYTSSSGTADEIFRINFPDGITGAISGTPLGNIGAMDKPHQFSEIFRVGDTLFTYVTNRQNNTLTRLCFLPCTNSSIASSAQFNPPPYSYNTTGVYNIQLIVDEGLPTQSSLCRSIVVMKSSLVEVDTTLCYGEKYFAGGQYRTVPGVYYDTLDVISGCDSIIKTNLRFKQTISVWLGNDSILCSGETFTLDATTPGASAYLWQDGSTLDKYTVNSPGIYWVHVTVNNCIGGDTLVVEPCPYHLVFPDAFTPDDDGLNDCFQPVGNNIASFHMDIYNRLGHRLFSTDDMADCWNGKWLGKICSPDVYVYDARFESAFDPGKIQKAKGTFNLIR